MPDDVPSRERATERHRELLERVREEDDDLAPVAEEILAEIDAEADP